MKEAVNNKELVLGDLHLFSELEYWSWRQYQNITHQPSPAAHNICLKYSCLNRKLQASAAVLQCAVCSRMYQQEQRQRTDCELQLGAKYLSISRVVVLLLVYSSRQNKHCNLGGMPNIPDISYFLTVNTAKIT